MSDTARRDCFFQFLRGLVVNQTSILSPSERIGFFDGRRSTIKRIWSLRCILIAFLSALQEMTESHYAEGKGAGEGK